MNAKETFFILSGICSFVALAFVPGVMAKALLVGFLLVIIAVALVTMLKKNASYRAIGELAEDLKNRNRLSGQYEVEFVQNRAQLRELWELDQKCYGEENISYETLYNWWSAYPKGIYLLLESNNIIGAMGIFPVKRGTFDLMLDGKLAESDLGKSGIISDSGMQSYWYISGIVLEIAYRRKRAISTLIRGALSSWLEHSNFGKEIHICSIAYSRSGENLLRRFKFYNYAKAEKTIFNHPTYLFETNNLQDLRTMLNRLLEQIPQPALEKQEG